MWISCLENVTLPRNQKCHCLWQSASDAPKAVVFQVLPALHWCCCDFLRSHLWAVDKDLSNGGFWKHQVHVLRHSKKKGGGRTMSVFCFLEESMYVFYRTSVDFLTLSRLLIDFSFFFFLLKLNNTSVALLKFSHREDCFTCWISGCLCWCRCQNQGESVCLLGLTQSLTQRTSCSAVWELWAVSGHTSSLPMGDILLRPEVSR